MAWPMIAAAAIQAGGTIAAKAMDGNTSAQAGSAGYTQHGHDAMWQFRHDLYDRANQYQGLGDQAFANTLPYAQAGADHAVGLGNYANSTTDALTPGAFQYLNAQNAGTDQFQQALANLSNAAGNTPTFGAPTFAGGSSTYQAPELNQELIAQFQQASGMYGNAMQNDVLPTFQQLNESARNFNSPAYADRLAGQASAQGAMSQQQAMDALSRQQASRGVNPNSGAAQAMGLQAATQNAANTAAARTNAYTQADQMGFDRLGAAAQQSGILGQLHNQALDTASTYDQSRMSNLTSLENQRMASDASMSNAATSANAGMWNAATSANASMYGAGLDAQVSGLNALNTRDYQTAQTGLGVMDSLNRFQNTSTLANQSGLAGLSNTYGGWLDSTRDAFNMHQTANSNVQAAFGGGSASQPATPASDAGYGAAVADAGGSLARGLQLNALLGQQGSQPPGGLSPALADATAAGWLQYLG